MTSTETAANLINLAELADKFDIRPIADVVLTNPQFALWSGSSKPEQHHYGKGGLIQHTIEVIELCLASNSYFTGKGKGVSDAVLFLAALFHDTGKIWDYEPKDPEYKDWQKTPHKRQIHHISRSAIVWHDAVTSTGMMTTEHDEIWHAILAHHGERLWGSPVSPATRLAWLLHLSDQMSARMDDCDRFMR